MSTSVFRPTEFGMALGFAAVVEIALVVLLVMAGSGSSLSSDQAKPPKEVPIAVTPVLEDLPLLKYGSPKDTERELPDMWRKPKPKKRYEDKSAPSVSADKNPATLPTNEVAKRDEDPAPPDAELAKKVDEDIEEDDTEDPNLAEEGHADGVIGGTETDALKAHRLGIYRSKLIAWFKAGLGKPQGAEYCGKDVTASAHVSSDGTFTHFSVNPSGLGKFDTKIRAHLDAKVGRKVPPPPPTDPDLLPPTINLRFPGENDACKNKSGATDDSKPSTGASDESEDSPEPPSAPAPVAPAPAGDDSLDGLLE